MSTGTGQAAKRPWIVPVVIVAMAALLIALVVAMAQRQPAPVATAEPSPAPTQASGQPDLTSVERRDPDDPLAAGPVDAPVTLIVFSDYQCPFCAQWSHETLPAMMKHAEAGDLRIEWRDVNILGPESERAARASYAAALQGKFWEYHRALFKDGKKRAKSDLSEDALIALAGELGLDTGRFGTDLAADKTAQQIGENERLGLELGVPSTPVFLMGGQPIAGAQPKQVFTDAFEQALAKAR